MMSDWWKKSTVYQVYPQSFKDSNGDGIGDLPGITEKMSYLQQLGINAIWLNPIYQSPLVDNGYDISDYYKINPIYGTMDDFKTMLEAAHEHGIKLIMDLVVNHTSDQHHWFKESKKSRDNPFSDYYIWRDPKPDGSAPNNWGASFGGSAWEYVPERGQYYLHLYAPQQPDLNWENPNMRQKIYAMMRFWFDMGVNGFRMDTINLLSKDQSFPDAPLMPNSQYGTAYAGSANGPRIHEFLQEMNREVLSKYDVMTVGETPHTTADEAALYVDPKRHELNMVFQFEHMHVDYGEFGRYSTVRFKLSDLRASMAHWQTSLTNRGWNSLFLNNHDQPRMVSRFGDDQQFRVQSAKMLAIILHLQQGTPFVFQGEELGMTNVKFNSIEQFRDLEAKNNFHSLLSKGLSEGEVMKMIRHKSRDNSRTPMQWNTSVNAGFTTGTPWIETNPNYGTINAASEIEDQDSVFNFYKGLISLRSKYDIITDGRFDLINPNDSAIFGFTRKLGNQILVVLGSFMNAKVKAELPDELATGDAKLLIGNYGTPAKLATRMYLKPYEGVAYLINHG